MSANGETVINGERRRPRDGDDRYDADFKLRVIREIEEEGLSANGARLKYGIGGKMTVHRWLKQSGKTHLLLRRRGPRVDYLAMSGKAGKLAQLRDRNRRLEAALADAQIRVLALESLVEVAEEHFGENIKKNFGSAALARQGRKRRGQGSP